MPDESPQSFETGLQMLEAIVKEMESGDLPLERGDTKGDLYEYLLSKLTTAGINGQFRTPRHIIKLMVEMTAPTPRDVICDPACGTAGFLIAHTSYLICFSVVGAYVFIAWLLLFTLSPKQVMVIRDTKPWESIKEGLRFVLHTREVLGALALDLFAVLFGGAVAMIPVYARDILKVGPIGFGWLNAADDIGSMCMLVILTLWPLKRRQGYVLLYAVFGFGVCIIVFGLSKLYLLSYFALICAGMMDGISVVIRGTIVQVKTPDAMRGRVSAVNSMFINSSNELGSFESGVMARLMRVVPSVVFGGCMTIAVVFTTWFRAPSLRKMEY